MNQEEKSDIGGTTTNAMQYVRDCKKTFFDLRHHKVKTLGTAALQQVFVNIEFHPHPEYLTVYADILKCVSVLSFFVSAPLTERHPGPKYHQSDVKGQEKTAGIRCLQKLNETSSMSLSSIRNGGILPRLKHN